MIEIASVPATFGQLNEHALVIILREAARRAAVHARRQLFKVTAEVKGVKKDGGLDVVTSADRESQAIVVKMLTECFPDAGVFGEEGEGKSFVVNPESPLWFTVDPIDGTKYYTLKESHGFACAISCVYENEVLSVCVMDIMTGEIYYFRPGSAKTHRIDKHAGLIDFEIDQMLPLAEQKVLLRERVRDYSRIAQGIVDGFPDSVGGGWCTPLFKKAEVTGGSIVAHMARLWKGSVGGTILRPGVQKPWDIVPVIGMCKRLGFVFIDVDSERERLTVFEPKASKIPVTWKNDVMIVHASRVEEAMSWFDMAAW